MLPPWLKPATTYYIRNMHTFQVYIFSFYQNSILEMAAMFGILAQPLEILKSEYLSTKNCGMSETNK